MSADQELAYTGTGTLAAVPIAIIMAAAGGIALAWKKIAARSAARR